MSTSATHRRTAAARLTAWLLVGVLALGMSLTASAVAKKKTASGSGKTKTGRTHRRVHKPGPRRGGHVRAAWPMTSSRSRRPRRALARFLARQVGPGKAVKRGKKRRTARVSYVPPVLFHTAGDINPGATAVEAPAATEKGALSLVRSFDIPADDPAHDRLLNLSFTYDSALAAIAFTQDGDRAEAERLLDQLAALQHKDGSLATAYDTGTGGEVPSYRSGTVAWVALAAATYEKRFHEGRYEALAQGAADWLLARRNDKTGLVQGGPDVTWVSTQHNLLTYFALRSLSDLDAQTEVLDSTQGDDGEAANDIADAIRDNLLVASKTGGLHFAEGIDDAIQPLDVQALGADFLMACGCSKDATSVLTNAVKAYAISDRTILRSADKDTYNETYESKGPFAGFKPYLDRGAPRRLWMEGTNQMRWAMDRFGYDTRWLLESLDIWTPLTKDTGGGILGANRTVTNNDFNEYHVWPTSAATSWGLIAQLADRDFLSA